MRLRSASSLASLTVLILLPLAIALLTAPPLRAADVAPDTRRPLKPEDFATLRDVGDPQLSPDGAVVAYTVRTTDLAKDKRPTNLWLAHADGSAERALTFGDNTQTHPRWSPDGRWLAFLSSRSDEDDNNQLWLLPRDGGEAEKLTDPKDGIDDFAWAPDSQHLVLVLRDPDPAESDRAKDQEKEKDKDSDKKTPPPIVIDRYQFKKDEDGYLTRRYSHLHLFDLATRQLTPLTSGDHDDLLPAWSPDGRTIAFVSKRGDDPDRTDNWDLYLIAPEPGAKDRQLTTAPEADAHPDWWESPPAWSPDSRWIAYLHGSDPKKITYATNALAVISAATPPADVSAAGPAKADAHVLTAAADRNLRSPRWASDGKSIFVLVENDGAQHLARVPFDLAHPALATAAVLAPAAPGRVYRDFDLARSDRIAVLASTPGRPYEIFLVAPDTLAAAPRALTHQNDAFLARVRLATVETTSCKSTDGTEVHGFLVRPLDPPPAGAKPPALLRPHGGPQAQYAADFNFEAQLFAAHGYTVILPNPRGSTGRGTVYAMGIYGAWGSVDIQDDLAAVDDAIARGLADPERLGVGGWSYGGMATNYLIASTTRFKAATSGASISNVLAGYGTDEYIRDYENELGSPWKNPEGWMRISYPFFHADRIKTPTLFLCGQDDFNVPLLNSEQMYQALRTLNVPTELVIYPDQFHRLTKPTYLLDRYQRYLAWYAKWIPASTP